MSPAAALASEVKIGFDAGWHLSIYKDRAEGKPLVSFGRNQYYADIRVSLADGLTGGSYALTVEGMTDGHYGEVAKAHASKERLIGKLFFYWTGGGALDYFADLVGLGDLLDGFAAEPKESGLVGLFALQQWSRRAGANRTEVTVTGRELVYDRLAVPRLLGPVQGKTTIDLVQEVARKHFDGVIKTYPLADDGGGGDDQEARPPPPEPNLGQPVSDVLSQLGRALEDQSRRYGRGMFLIRNGELHIGPDRPIPHPAGAAKPLDLGSGLLEVQVTGEIPTDPNWNYVDKQEQAPPTRTSYSVSLLGRPDIKPGDTVSFVPPPENRKSAGGIAGAAAAVASSAASVAGVDADPPVVMYVAAVSHTYSRTAGFVTQATGVDVTSGSAWDTHTPTGKPVSPAGDTAKASTATAPGKAAAAVQAYVGNTTAGRRLLEVGQVRGATTRSSSNDLSQTIAAFRGLVASDGEPRRAHRQAIELERPMTLAAVPYASPFAFGKCGLVLPRYPGMRILLEHRNGFADDPIDVGALWDAGKGPDSQPGDWWLILPTEVEQRQTVAESEEPELPSGKGTNDLIDADGNRVIELGELTIRVGRNSLRPVGERPKRAKDDGGDDGAITITHADGKASLVIKADGTIVIHAAKDLRLEADGDVKVKARNVEVQVDGKVDVK